MKLIFLHGLPGVGKLTGARALGELTGFGVFHNHLAVDLVGAVFEFGSRPFVELREMIWLAVFSRAAEAGAFVDPGMPPGRLVVDTTDISAAAAARLIAGKLGLT